MSQAKHLEERKLRNEMFLFFSVFAGFIAGFAFGFFLFIISANTPLGQ